MPIDVNPEILVWARKAAGLDDVKDAAVTLRLTDSARSTAAQKLEALEAGKRKPTRNQLEAMANAYRRPLLTFYMAKPPRQGQRVHDFRQTPNTHEAAENARLDALLRDVRVRQETVRDILEEDEGYGAPDFVGSVTFAQGVKHTVAAIVDKLRFDHTDPKLRQGDTNALFKRLRSATEKAGVFVLILGDLGSYHTSIPATVFRGFAIADRVAPFVVINARDAQSARSFTLIHELAHVFLGQTGVSGSVSTATPTTENARLERFCNDVASEFLLPGILFGRGIPPFERDNVNAARNTVEAIAGKWSVSEPMVAYRLHRTGNLSTDAYNKLHGEYETRWQAKLKRDGKDGNRGPNPRVLKLFNLGDALTGLVHRAVRDNLLSHTKAAAILGSRPGAVEPILRHFESRLDSFVAKTESAN